MNPGQAHIQAYIDWVSPNLYSNVVTIACSPPCIHNPIVTDVTVVPDPDRPGDHLVTITFDMGDLTNDDMGPFTPNFDSKTNTDGSISYNDLLNTITYDIKITANNGKYTMELKYPVTADCTDDGLKYKRSATFKFSGTWSAVDSWSQPTYTYL
jgi:hypothetical protein